MAVPQNPTNLQEEEVQAEAPSHHPSPPPDELFEVSTTVDPSYVISLIRKLLPTTQAQAQPQKESMELDQQQEQQQQHHNHHDHDSLSLGVGDQAWEDYGCILWDLAANKTHADFMVENLLLQVLSANLMVQQSARAIEICLGIIGNLACHEGPMRLIVSTNGLIELIVNQLFLDDTQCLCEACRLFSLGLRSSESSTWAAAIQSEHVLCRILWIAENSLNLQLVEKTVELLLAIIESSQEVMQILLPPLIKMGLPSALLSLLACEISQLMNEKVLERLSILDVTLRAIEAISVIDGHSEEISSSKELFQLVCQLVKISDKAEVANSCVTAAVLIANILSDVPDLASEISNDLNFLQGLLDIFPFASDDLEARSALWSIMAGLLLQVQESEMSLSALCEYVSVLASKSDLIEDDLLDYQLDGSKSNARTTALRRMINILNLWTVSKDEPKENDQMAAENQTINADISRLLDCCRKHTE
ncbi:uncharacterized protein LOC133798698 [Humulus lupulus]|uniref:uncharacterized protein LOC133798698 n=1 Tax=Humulus lupulus TaxID=3486 RepID=UPI002B401C7C|nr:uncharacterized protein LOC133798698 [Humulus lupulus]